MKLSILDQYNITKQKDFLMYRLAFTTNRNILYNKLRNEIIAINKLVSSKRGLTDKMMIYLFNYLVIPVVEYCIQLIVISEKVLNSLMTPFRMLLKNRLKLVRTAPNAILKTNLIYNLNDLVSNQR